MKYYITILCILTLLVGCSQADDIPVEDSSEPQASPTPDLVEEDLPNETPEQEDVGQAPTMEDILAHYNDDLKHNRYEALANDYTYSPEMGAVATVDFYESLLISLASGNIVDQQAPVRTETDGYVIFSTPTVFETGSMNLNLVFDGDMAIAGLNVGLFTGILPDAEALDPALVEIPLTAEVNGLSLDGILTKPADLDTYPVVILVHGSGPSDKDESIMANTPFKDLAYGLALAGIGSYRYDKSTYAYSNQMAAMTDLTVYEETINDAARIADMIAERSDVSQVYVLGHSLGGHVIPLIAEETQVDGYIIMAGNVRPLTTLMAEQIPYILNFDGQLTDEEAAYQETFMADLQKAQNPESIEDGQAVLGAYKAYWAFLKDYSPLDHAQSMDVPVLVVQGQRDYQVTMEDFDLWQTLDKANFTYISYPNLNHLMMPGQGPSIGDEYAIPNEVSEDFITDLAEWIHNQ